MYKSTKVESIRIFVQNTLIFSYKQVFYKKPRLRKIQNQEKIKKVAEAGLE